MCGILGFVGRDGGQIDVEDFLRARETMIHRGPDDSGFFMDGSVMLAHRRLSIIDIGGGHQPMSALGGAVWIVFNGEIYNFRELRAHLKGKGHSFQTNSDTEVLLNLYLEDGIKCFDKLNGIFAFAILDQRSGEVHLVRDQVGVKPLYYAASSRGLIFASEIKSLLATGVVSAELESDAIPEYLLFRDVAGTRTLFRGVKRLLPGHHLCLANDRMTIRQYSQLNSSNQESFDGSFVDAVDALESHLNNSVRMQMVSDVPLGTFCSGGVDSSLITALAVRHANGPIDTFSIGFKEAAYDESRFARQVAQHLETRHHELILDSWDFAGSLPRMIWHNDEPLHFANSVHIHALSQLARKHVTVVLTGEGADELFGGYPRYQIPTLVRRWKRLPRVVRKAVVWLALSLGDHRLNKLDRVLDQPDDMQLLMNCAVADVNLFGTEISLSKAVSSYRRSALDSAASMADGINLLSLLDQQTYLLSILNRQDKMSMATSIESRVPFLDTRLVRFAQSLPHAFKQARFDNKRVVKALALRHLPPDVIKRRKSGFGVPLTAWFRKDAALGDLAQAHFSNDLVGSVFGTDNLRQLHAEHLSGSLDHSETLWAALNLALWQEQFKVHGQYDPSSLSE